MKFPSLKLSPSLSLSLGLAFALGLPVSFSTASAAEVAGSADPAEAVRAARSTALPAWKDLAKKESEVLTGFGGGDRSLVTREESYWQSGKGDLYGPSVNRTIRCRSASDPECLAVQVLDRRFTDRPAVPDSMLAGRDEIINGLGNPPSGSNPGTCQDFSISIPAIRQEMTCSAGAPFIDQTCLTGWETSGASNDTRWACFIAPEMGRTFTCRVPAGFSTTTETHYTCLFDGSALAPEREERILTSATASALFPASCRAPQMSVTTVTCSETLSVSGAPSCQTGSSASVSAEGDAALKSDGCSGFDTLTLSHTCRPETSDAARQAVLSINGAANRLTLRGTGKGQITKGACKASINIESHTCSGASGTSCTVKARALIYNGSSYMGKITAVLAYEGWSSGGGLVEEWTDGCKGITGASQEASND